jgi:hypothetical protein
MGMGGGDEYLHLRGARLHAADDIIYIRAEEADQVEGAGLGGYDKAAIDITPAMTNIWR